MLLFYFSKTKSKRSFFYFFFCYYEDENCDENININNTKTTEEEDDDESDYDYDLYIMTGRRRHNRHHHHKEKLDLTDHTNFTADSSQTGDSMPSINLPNGFYFLLWSLAVGMKKILTWNRTISSIYPVFLESEERMLSI